MQAQNQTQTQTQAQVQVNQVNQIIRLPGVINMVGMKRANIYLLMKEGKFPLPLKLGTKANGWIVAEVQNWIDERINARDEQNGAAK